MPYADPEKRKTYARERSARRRRENPERDRAYQREWRKKHQEITERWRTTHPEKVYGYHRKWEAKHQQERNAYHLEQRHRLKLHTIKEYGARCSICGERDHLKLTLDHSFNDGGTFRKQFPGRTMSGVHFYAWLKRQQYPKNLGLRVLCAKCNKAEYVKSRRSA